VAKSLDKPIQLVVPQKVLLACVTDGLMNPIRTEVSDLLDRARNSYARYIAFDPSIVYWDVFSMDPEPLRDIANRACPTGNAYVDRRWIEICEVIEFECGFMRNDRPRKYPIRLKPEEPKKILGSVVGWPDGKSIHAARRPF
jgi:hypothetical protein